MRRSVMLFTVLFISTFLVFSAYAQGQRFDHIGLIQADTLDVGGYGEIVSGVDLDGDGLLEIYAINTDWYDIIGYDLVPRIYKYEQDGSGNWATVWSTVLPDISFQNTWGALEVGDLDQDGKWEIIWGVVNNFGGGLQPNPPRVVVYELFEAGEDYMGIPVDATTSRPNAMWTITDGDNENIRPIRWYINDIDGDGTDEIVAGARAGDGIQVYSVDDIPDAGDGSETWTLEFSGIQSTFYDVGILDNHIVGIDAGGDVYMVTWDATGDSFAVAGPQVGLAGSGSWKSVTTVDVDGDETHEMIVASWGSTDNDVYLLQMTDADTLMSTKIQDVPGTSWRSYGGAAGDLDMDGNLDFVFGTRQSTPNGIIHRLEYQGGAIDDPNNWFLSIIDKDISPASQYDIIDVVDVNGDGDDEPIYTGTPRGISSDVPPQPIVILDIIPDNQPIITAVVDVPNDQGRQVWVVWEASTDDAVPVVDGQAVQIGIVAPEGVEFPLDAINGIPVKAVSVAQNGDQIAAAGDITEYGVWRVDNGSLPVQLNTTAAVQFAMYAAVVPTLGDGMDWESAFVVSAHTMDPAMNWKSFARTGMSEDNLIPTAPANLSATPGVAQVDLVWDESPDPDFNYFSIRRGESEGFDAMDANTEVGTTTEPMYVDEAVEAGKTYYYKVVAYDFNENMGSFSDEVMASVTAIGDDMLATPKEFALRQNYPNPFNPTTRIAYDLAEMADVKIVIYDALGSKIRTLVNASKAAGSYNVTWDGLNDAGNKVASGVYIYTINAGNFNAAKKMTLMR